MYIRNLDGVNIPLDERLTPPGREVGLANLHYVRCFDSGGQNNGGVDIFQWQPGVKAWCLPNQIATGSASNIYLDKRRTKYLGVCPLPDPENEEGFFDGLAVKATRLHRKIQDHQSFTSEDLELIRQFCILHGYPI